MTISKELSPSLEQFKQDYCRLSSRYDKWFLASLPAGGIMGNLIVYFLPSLLSTPKAAYWNWVVAFSVLMGVAFCGLSVFAVAKLHDRDLKKLKLALDQTKLKKEFFELWQEHKKKLSHVTNEEILQLIQQWTPRGGCDFDKLDKLIKEIEENVDLAEKAIVQPLESELENPSKYTKWL